MGNINIEGGDDLYVSPGSAYKVAGLKWKTYEIDFSRVNELEDVINILRGLQIKIVNPEDHPELKPYLKEVKETP